MSHASTSKQDDGTYRIVLSHEAKHAGFNELAGLRIEGYRAAQDLCNAIKEHMQTKEEKAANKAESE